MTPSKFWQLISLWYWYSVNVDFVPKVSIRHWDYKKVSFSTYMFSTRELNFSNPPTYVDIQECYRFNLFSQLPVYCSYVGSLILGICIGYWFWMEWVIFLWALLMLQMTGPDFVPTTVTLTSYLSYIHHTNSGGNLVPTCKSRNKLGKLGSPPKSSKKWAMSTKCKREAQ